MSNKQGISSFSALLLMAVTAVVGITCLSQLKVQYTPSVGERTICVNYYYSGASARIVEAEVTSKIEGILSGICGISDISSISMDGWGSVSLTIGKHADIQVVRFEIASKIRNLWTSLPKQCTYPEISLNSRGERRKTAIAFNISSHLPSNDIARLVKDNLISSVSIINGVSDVELLGDVPFEWVISFKPEVTQLLGITITDIRSALVGFYADRMLGMTKKDENTFGVKIRSNASYSFGEGIDFSVIPVKKVEGRIVRLGEIASFRYQEIIPDSYYRINGLNTLILSVEVAPNANLLSVVRSVKKEVERLQKSIPEEISISISYDYSKRISDELNKIIIRTALCLLILLLFVFIVNRSWRYMIMIVLTIAVNILISVAIYYFLGIPIHIYTLAGITVSLGIIIDNSIVMIDHWIRHRDRRVFPALLCAVFTTVVSLLVVLLLPDREKENLTDFIYIITINLSVSLAVAYFFVPALLDYFPIERIRENSVFCKRIRRMARWNECYERYIIWGIRHRWVLVLAFLVLFGIPSFLLPMEFGNEKKAPLKNYEKVLNKIIGWPLYADNRVLVDKILGSSFALFNNALSRSDFYREPIRETLFISASMPEGCNVQQLNEVMRHMELFLECIDSIEMFETSISSPREGHIYVLFKPEAEDSWIPHKIKADIISMANDFGGADWVVTGFDENSFNNNIFTDSRSHCITISGYNYDKLLEFGGDLKEFLSKQRRVRDPIIWGGDVFDHPSTEFSIGYDFAKLAVAGIPPNMYWEAVVSSLYSSSAFFIPQENDLVGIRIESSDRESFDIWHVGNTAIELVNGKAKLSDLGEIAKDQTGLPIRKNQQSYLINVKFNFLGSWQLAQKTIDDAVNYMNEVVLPVGFKAENEAYRWFYKNKEKYAGLILLVIAIIFIICAVFFNSLRYPFAIIWMIPIAFVGAFLAFGLSNFSFDKGGFAAFVMLCGITVNAGIYLLSAWKNERVRVELGGSEKSSVHRYIRSFNQKIWPISLTLFSTILGLVPFLSDGPREVFWFSFAVGTISGLLFSVVAFVLYLPVFCIRKTHIPKTSI